MIPSAALQPPTKSGTLSVTRQFPRDELYGLTSQLRRAAVSIPSNIAEGKGRVSDKELNVFLCHARGSLHEVETQLLIAKHLGYIGDQQALQLSALSKEVGRLLNGLISFAASA